MIPPPETVYYGSELNRPAASFKLYPPTQIPDLPSAKIIRVKDCFTAEQAASFGWDLDMIIENSWPDTRLSLSDRHELEVSQMETILEMCQKKQADDRYDAQLPPVTTITLETPLATGCRSERPAQVWRVNATDSSTPLVARIYDPLYYPTTIFNRFAIIDQAVSCENEAYNRLEAHQGTLVPRFRGVFVTEIPGERPRRVYVVLLEYLPGIDLQKQMRRFVSEDPHKRTGTVDPETPMSASFAEATCLQHKAGIFNAVARASYHLYLCGVHPDDLFDRNVLFLEPQQSKDDFCTVVMCPFRNTLHIDLGNSPFDEHPHAPRLCIIDLEDVHFETRQYMLPDCRGLLHQWEHYSAWLQQVPISSCFQD
ncbi:hypothetical protein C8R43DRAFT_349016 [Mycena crocata]|nr:hypothetical protein C8R43DRAFT_349016 [Mycena crocata]